MIAFDVKKMSDDEWNFIRLYCSAVRQDYYLMQIICALLSPDFDIKKVNEAVRFGLQLQEQQEQVVQQIYDVGEKYGHKRPTTDNAPYELIAEVFTKSFFKLIDSATKSVIVLDKKATQHDGWSSGNPADWQSAIHDMQEIHVQKLQSKSAAESILVSALFNLFSLLPKNFPLSNWGHPDYAEEGYDDWDEDSDYFDDDDDSAQYFS